MRLYERDYIKKPPTKEEIDEYNSIKKSEINSNSKLGRINKEHFYPKAIKQYKSLFPNNYIETSYYQNNDSVDETTGKFYDLIHAPNTNERDILRFINHTPAFYIVAGILNWYHFGHHKAFVFPEFVLGSYRADYLLIGSGSGGYEFIFVEFELPNGRITLQSGHEGQAIRSGNNQIRDWKHEIESNFESFSAELKKYTHKDTLPNEFIKYDSSRFHYVVVAGTREDYNETTYRDRRVAIQQENVKKLHYDNLYDEACRINGKHTF